MTATDSTIVVAEGTFEEHVRELVTYLARGLADDARPAYFRPFQEAIEGIDSGSPSPALDERKRKAMTLVLGAVKSLGEGSDREIDGFFNLLYFRIFTVFTDPPALQEQLTPLIHVITTSPDHTFVKYRVLSNLFNALPRTAPLRLPVYNALLTVASSQDDVEALSIRKSEVKQWLLEWDVPQADKSALLKSIADAFAKADQMLNSYEYHLMYIRSLSSSSPEAASATVDALALALRLPSVLDFDPVLRLETVNLVKDHPLLSLVRVLVGGSFSDLKGWIPSHDAALAQFKLDRTLLERKMRLLTLANLGTQNVGAKVSYSTIASALHVDIKDVEAWVIDGMRANLIGGKLSQPSQTLHITRATYHVFKPTDWKYLQDRLVGWKTDLLGVLEVVTATRQARTTTNHKSRPLNIVPSEAEQSAPVAA